MSFLKKREPKKFFQDKNNLKENLSAKEGFDLRDKATNTGKTPLSIILVLVALLLGTIGFILWSVQSAITSEKTQAINLKPPSTSSSVPPSDTLYTYYIQATQTALAERDFLKAGFHLRKAEADYPDSLHLKTTLLKVLYVNCQYKEIQCGLFNSQMEKLSNIPQVNITKLLEADTAKAENWLN